MKKNVLTSTLQPLFKRDTPKDTVRSLNSYGIVVHLSGFFNRFINSLERALYLFSHVFFFRLTSPLPPPPTPPESISLKRYMLCKRVYCCYYYIVLSYFLTLLLLLLLLLYNACQNAVQTNTHTHTLASALASSRFRAHLNTVKLVKILKISN